MNLVPIVIEQTARGERSYDIYSRLLRDRIIMIGSTIDDTVANSVMAQMIFLEGDNPDTDISLYINTLGGSVSAGLAIYDTMQFIKPDVQTWCIGQAYSMGAVSAGWWCRWQAICAPSFNGTDSPANQQWNKGAGIRYQHTCRRNP